MKISAIINTCVDLIFGRILVTVVHHWIWHIHLTWIYNSWRCLPTTNFAFAKLSLWRWGRHGNIFRWRQISFLNIRPVYWKVWKISLFTVHHDQFNCFLLFKLNHIILEVLYVSYFFRTVFIIRIREFFWHKVQFALVKVCMLIEALQPCSINQLFESTALSLYPYSLPFVVGYFEQKLERTLRWFNHWFQKYLN